MVKGLILLMKTADEVTGPINLGNPEEHSILEMAERILKLTGSKSEIIFEPLPQDDPEKRQPDISVARKILGWSPTVTLEEGLPKTIDYFDNLLRTSK
jgi:UDP-glucuronate decarboxylase